jgi:hypothetical protein
MASANPSTLAPMTFTGKSQGYSISDSLWASVEMGGCEEALIKLNVEKPKRVVRV